MDLKHVEIPPKATKKPRQPRPKKTLNKPKAALKPKGKITKAPPTSKRKKIPVVDVVDEDSGPVALEVVDDSSSVCSSSSDTDTC